MEIGDGGKLLRDGSTAYQLCFFHVPLWLGLYELQNANKDDDILLCYSFPLLGSQSPVFLTLYHGSVSDCAGHR